MNATQRTRVIKESNERMRKQRIVDEQDEYCPNCGKVLTSENTYRLMGKFKVCHQCHTNERVDTCSDCEELICKDVGDDESVEGFNGILCESCKLDECTKCGEWYSHTDDDLYHSGEHEMCPDCMSNEGLL